MVIYFILIATLNFGVGFALAAWQTYRSVAAAPPPATTVPPPDPPQPEGETSAEQSPAEVEEDAHPIEAEETHSWNIRLEEVFQPALDLDVFDHRRRLISLMERAANTNDAETARELTEEFGATVTDWAASCAAARERLEERREMVEDCKIWAERLIASLNRMETPADSQVSRIGDASDPGAAGRRIIDCGAELLEEAELLRDVQDEARLAVLQWTGNLESAPQEQLRDPQTGLLNRLGLEMVHQQWLLQHPREPRSLAVLDVDGFAEVNRRLGPTVGDRILAAFASLVDDLLRKDSGFDRAARYDADSFVIFLGDTPLENAVNAVERIRQVIEASSFATATEKLELTVSIGVAAGSGREILADVLCDAREAAAQAKEEGGNCTARHTEYGPQTEAPRPYDIRGRVVRVDAGNAAE